MRYQRPYTLLWIVSCIVLLLLTACDTTNNSSAGASRSWMLTWNSHAGAQQSNSPEMAFTTSASAQRPDGTLTNPVSATWIATGSDFGLVFVQLDPAGQYMSIGMLGIDTSSNRWALAEGFSIEKPTTGNGIPTSRQDSAWTLPPGDYTSGSANLGGMAPEGIVRAWVSDTNKIFILARVASTVQRPASNTTTVTIGQKSGWLTEQNGITRIVLKLVEGTFVFAGTASPDQSRSLVAQAMVHLNDLL